MYCEKRFLIILFVLIVSNLYSQSELKVNNSLNKFRIGIFYSLDENLSSKNMIIDTYTGYSINYNKNNYRAGVNLEYELNSRFSLNSGLNYSNKNFTWTFYCHVCNFITPPQPEEVKLQYIEIPISGRYYFLATKTRFFAETGFINQFAIDSEVIEKKYLLSGRLGVGIEYNINENLGIQFITDYTKGLSSNLFKNSEIKSELKNEILGFRLGIVKRL